MSNPKELCINQFLDDYERVYANAFAISHKLIAFAQHNSMDLVNIKTYRNGIELGLALRSDDPLMNMMRICSNYVILQGK